MILESLKFNKQLNIDDLVELLSLEKPEAVNALFKKAYETKLEYVGNKVYYRGIIEFSNVCTKNCEYCGIRKGNLNVKRFSMSEEEILKGAEFAFTQKYGSVVLQSGERSDSQFVDFVENILRKIKTMSDGKLGVTLSLGEQSEDTYRRWFEAGAHRYLLRIESSDKALYQSIHPDDHDYDHRLECLKRLKKCGYQVGTGVMIGLPGQGLHHLAQDIQFFRDMDIDMIGMGPYIRHKDTPMGQKYPDYDNDKGRIFSLALKMIAVTRLALKDVNIASTTALQALQHDGREWGLKAGANIIMPNITDTKYRESYQLYQDKPCMDENAGMCRFCLEKRIGSVGEEVGYNEWGDSPHFKKNEKRKL